MSCCNCKQDSLFLAQAVVELRKKDNHDQVLGQYPVTRLVRTYSTDCVENIVLRNLNMTSSEGTEYVIISIDISEELE